MFGCPFIVDYKNKGTPTTFGSPLFKANPKCEAESAHVTFFWGFPSKLACIKRLTTYDGEPKHPHWAKIRMVFSGRGRDHLPAPPGERDQERARGDVRGHGMRLGGVELRPFGEVDGFPWSMVNGVNGQWSWSIDRLCWSSKLGPSTFFEQTKKDMEGVELFHPRNVNE